MATDPGPLSDALAPGGPELPPFDHSTVVTAGQSTLARLRKVDPLTWKLLACGLVGGAVGFTLGMRLARLLGPSAGSPSPAAPSAARAVPGPQPQPGYPTAQAAEAVARDVGAQATAGPVAAASADLIAARVAAAVAAQEQAARNGAQPDHPVGVTTPAGVPLEAFEDPTVAAAPPLDGVMTLDKSATPTMAPAG